MNDMLKPAPLLAEASSMLQDKAFGCTTLLHFILIATRERPSIKNMMVGCCTSQWHKDKQHRL